MTHKPHVYIQRHTTTRILASLTKVCTNKNDDHNWEQPYGRFFLPTSQLITDIRSTRKTCTKKNKVLNPYDWIPNHQFGFRQAHSRVQQRHRITDVINKAMENRQYCTAVILDISQAFDKVSRVLFKIKRLSPLKYFNMLKSYLSERQFETTLNGEGQAAFTSTP
jgi:hypothetical protein